MLPLRKRPVLPKIFICGLSTYALVVLLSPPWVSADVTRELAPGPSDFDTSEDALRKKLLDAEAIGTAFVRIQNRQAVLLRKYKKICGNPEAEQLAVRARIFGEAWRHATQSVRAQTNRVQRLVRLATIEPLLLIDQQRNVLDDLLERSRRQTRWWAEAAAWYQRFIRPISRKCQPSLEPAAGFDAPQTAVSSDSKAGNPLIAMIAIGNGRVYP